MTVLAGAGPRAIPSGEQLSVQTPHEAKPPGWTRTVAGWQTAPPPTSEAKGTTDMSEWQTIEYEAADRIAHVRLNRPHVLNAIDLVMMRELPQALARAESDGEVRVIVLSGAGKSFGAGFDLKIDWSEAFGGRGAENCRDMLSACVVFEITPWDCRKPVIAMVRGHCVAGSCELAMMCCVTFASEDAIFGEPEIRFSTAPPAIVMPWVVGLKKARELLYTGDLIGAREAEDIGMVNRVFPDEDLEAETFRYARRLAAVELEALKATKPAINQNAEIMGFRQSIRFGIETGAILDATPTEMYKRFSEIRKRDGLGAAIRWREAQFEE